MDKTLGSLKLWHVLVGLGVFIAVWMVAKSYLVHENVIQTGQGTIIKKSFGLRALGTAESNEVAAKHEEAVNKAIVAEAAKA